MKATNGAGKDPEGSPVLLIAIGVLLLAGAGGAVAYYRGKAQEAGQRLQQAKDDYREMATRMKKPVEEYLLSRKLRPALPANTVDMMTFLDKKAREAQIPAGLFTIAKNANQVNGVWQEVSYTVTLQSPAKESPVKRTPVVDFLRRVELEQRTTKTKNLQLAYSGDDFRSAIITISQFLPK